MSHERVEDAADADATGAASDTEFAQPPFCAFSEAFACPLPLEANKLDIPIGASERRP